MIWNAPGNVNRFHQRETIWTNTGNGVLSISISFAVGDIGAVDGTAFGGILSQEGIRYSAATDGDDTPKPSGTAMIHELSTQATSNSKKRRQGRRTHLGGGYVEVNLTPDGGAWSPNAMTGD